MYDPYPLPRDGRAYIYVNMSYVCPGLIHNIYVNSGDNHEWYIPTEVGEDLGSVKWYRYRGIKSDFYQSVPGLNILLAKFLSNIKCT